MSNSISSNDEITGAATPIAPGLRTLGGWHPRPDARINEIDMQMLIQSYIAAENSPDPSTQNGATLWSGKTIISTDCNRMPTGVNLNSFRLTRPQKYDYMVHAEVATILRGFRHVHATTTNDSLNTLYVIWYACADCARVIIESGVKRVVGHWQAHQFCMTHGQQKWRNSVRAGLEMLIESGVACDWYDGTLQAPIVRINGYKFNPNLIEQDMRQ